MSVLVKNMKMPNACAECHLNHDKMLCSVTGTQWWSDRFILLDFDEYNERLPDCPLLELPEKHGRLIDGDALVTEMTNGIRAGNLEDGYEKYQNINNMDDCVECVKYADVVIEAEGEKPYRTRYEVGEEHPVAYEIEAEDE